MTHEISVRPPFIRLDALLKLCNLVLSGGEAKTLIQEGQVCLNGAICTERGKKIKDGDVVILGDEVIRVSFHASSEA
ncbi:MAG: RNA-binding S4 domain-containing protein [Clostridia bacterium]|nr:RNA-binding S4 domain-containing protein [Clostridia bacterium]